MHLNRAHGFTLIELIVGIVVIAIVTLVVTAGLGQLFRQSVDPWQQVRAAEIGQSLMNEIVSQRFDEPGEGNNLLLRCSEEGAPACTAIPACDEPPEHVEEASPDAFDDVDDYHCLVLDGMALSHSPDNQYRGFEARVFVEYEQQNLAKRITIEVLTPQQERIQFQALKGNW